MVQLLSGRMPDQSNPDEVLASYTLARDNGARIGSVIQVLTPTPAQVKMGPVKIKIAALPRRSMRVVGFVVAENEFPAGNGARYDLFPTKAFAAAVNHRAGRCCVVPSLRTLEHDRDAVSVQMVIARSSKAMRNRCRLGVSVATS